RVRNPATPPTRSASRQAVSALSFIFPCCIRSVSLPATAEGAIELHQRQQLVTSRLRQPQFGFEQVAVGIERVQERGDSTAVSHVRQTRSVLECGLQQLPLHTHLSRLSILNECVRHLAEGG